MLLAECYRAMAGVGRCLGKEEDSGEYLGRFDSLECTLPVGDKDVHVVWDGKELKVEEGLKGESVKK